MRKIKSLLLTIQSTKQGRTVWQFVKFSFVGLSNTIISLGMYWLCFYGLHWHYQISNLIGFIISVTNAYYWNSKYVFMNTRSMGLSTQIVAYFKVFLSYGGTYLLGVALLYVWVEKLGISEGIAPMINLIITIPLNFILNKLWAFKSDKP